MPKAPALSKDRREPVDYQTLPLFSSADSVGSENDHVLDDPYFPSRLSEIAHRLWYVLTYRI